jgi:sigma-B regulation protein RsbU (phosphoserine phosphatase)
MDNKTGSDSQTFEAIFNNAPCGLFTYEVDGNITQVNRTFLKWLGVKKDEVLNVKFTDLLDKGGRLYYHLFVAPLLRIHNEVKEINFHIETAEGGFPCLFSATIVEKAKDCFFVSAAIFKVTDRKKYERELLHKKAEAEKEKEFQVETLKEVAWEQSHLVRAPLANVLGLISLLDDYNLNEEGRNLQSMLKTSAMQLDDELRKIITKATNQK